MRNSSNRLILLGFATGLAGCSGSARGNELSNSQVAAIDAVFRRFKPGTPGCAVGVYRDGRVLFAKGYGSADLERNVPITPSTIFDLGSTSKQFAAASILLLAADGKLALTDEIQKYVPEIPRYQWPVTVDHLLRHTSGLRDYIGLMTLGGFKIDDVTDDSDALAAISRQKALNFEPGSRWLYSNSGYFLLSTIVQRVSGKTLAEFAQERIFTPLGMTETHFRTQHRAILPNRALAYAAIDSIKFEHDMSNWEQTGDGAVQSSVLELAKWDGNWADPKVGGQELLDGLTTPGNLNDGKSHGYGRGIFSDKYQGIARFHHGGAWGGYRAMYLRFPEHHIGIGITCNVGNANTSELADGVADAMLREVLAGQASADTTPKPAAGAAPVAVTGAAATRLAGTYFAAEPETVARIFVRGDTAQLSAYGLTFPIAEGADGKLVAGPFFTLTAASGDPAPMILLGARGSPDSLSRVPTAKPSAAELAAIAGTYHSPELEVTWRITADSGKLTARARALGNAELVPLFPDAYSVDGSLIRLTRAGGRVTGFTLSAGRMKGIVFGRGER
jgi:CubicO group peptidase (beta-lactamase class C family)